MQRALDQRLYKSQSHIPCDLPASIIPVSVSSSIGISKLYVPILLSSSITFPIMSMRAPPTMKYDSSSAFRAATSRGRAASSSRQTKSDANFSLLISRLA